jgi:hypothetical protein
MWSRCRSIVQKMPSFAAQAHRLLFGESRQIKTQPVTNVQRFYRLSW